MKLKSMNNKVFKKQKLEKMGKINEGIRRG